MSEKNTAASLGEHRIIQLIQQRLAAMPNAPVPFGDDVAAVNLDGQQVAVLKTDMLVAKIDVPKTMSPYQAARKAVVMNISDFASKGVQPLAALVALCLPSNFAQREIEEIARGLNDGAREYGAYVVGGDTSQAQDLIISVSLYGTANKKTLMLRNGAAAGDVLAVTGFFGKPAAGLRLLADERCWASANARSALLDAVLMPKARLREGLALSGSGAVSASIDSSDGLAWSLHELARQSKVGFTVDNLPVANEAKAFAKKNRLEAAELALYGGEEYELVVTVKPERWAAAEAVVKSVGGCLLRIGKATENPELTFQADGKLGVIEPRGWEHFKSEP
jgi:thiamine-monophosphate kinase